MIFSHISTQEILEPSQLEMLKHIYEGEVHRSDHFMGEVVQKSMQSTDDFAIVITSDHGEYWGEHGLLDHGRTVYPEVLQVPLLVLDSQTHTKKKFKNWYPTKTFFLIEIIRYNRKQGRNPL